MKNQARIARRSEGNVTVAELLDEEILDETTIAEVGEALFTVVEENPGLKLVVSFGRVKHLSSMALGILIRLGKRVEESRGSVKLCEIRASLHEIFVITKLNRLFEIYDTEEMAVNSFSG